MIFLAVVTGIPAEQWAAEGSRGIATAFDVIREINEARSKGRRSSTSDAADQPQYSG